MRINLHKIITFVSNVNIFFFFIKAMTMKNVFKMLKERKFLFFQMSKKEDDDFQSRYRNFPAVNIS